MSDCTNPSEPGTVGTPASFIVALAEALSPIRSIISGDAPINLIPCSAQIFENLAFSERNPYPGWIASALVISAAAIILGIFKYESLLAGGPIHTASSAKRTCKLSASAVEYTATDLIPISLQVRITRKAISPRLAINIFLNIVFLFKNKGFGSHL